MIELINKINELGLDAVCERYKLNAKYHSTHPNLVLVKYNQIESLMSEKVVQQARGIILDTANHHAPVSRPFDKFFNHGEGHAVAIDWASAKVLEKLDGSLLTMYFYGGQWHVSTSGVPDAECDVNDYGFTFRELFWRVFNQMGYQVPTDTEMCYMFELMTPYNRVVVRHDFNRLVLIGARNMRTMEEADVASLAHLNYNVVRSFSGMDSFDAIDKSMPGFNPINQEGYVVVDGNFGRVKVKHPGYVAIHHMKGGSGRKALLEIIRSGEKSELISYFPEYADTFNEIQAKYDELVSSLDAAYDTHKGIESQKEFALAIRAIPANGALFARRSGKVETVKQFLAAMSIDNLMQLLKMK